MLLRYELFWARYKTESSLGTGHHICSARTESHFTMLTLNSIACKHSGLIAIFHQELIFVRVVLVIFHHMLNLFCGLLDVGVDDDVRRNEQWLSRLASADSVRAVLWLWQYLDISHLHCPPHYTPHDDHPAPLFLFHPLPRNIPEWRQNRQI